MIADIDYLKMRKLKEQKEIEDKLSKRVVHTKLVPKGICLNMFGYFFTQDKSWIDVYALNHESIHTAQQKELLYIPFYIIYLIEWVIRYFQYKDWKKAYYNISFEKEAYTWGNELWYLDNRTDNAPEK